MAYYFLHGLHSLEVTADGLDNIRKFKRALVSVAKVLADPYASKLASRYRRERRAGVVSDPVTLPFLIRKHFELIDSFTFVHLWIAPQKFSAFKIDCLRSCASIDFVQLKKLIRRLTDDFGEKYLLL